MLLLAMLLQAASPQGAPVYLKCSLTDAGGTVMFDLQLNETNNTVTYSFTREGITRTIAKPALFTPERVAFNSFSVSRTSLSFQRDNRGSAFFNASSGDAPIDRGQCVVNNVKRAF